MSNIQFPTVVEGRFGSVVAGLAEAGDFNSWPAPAGPATGRHDPMTRRFPLANDAEGAKEERGRAGSGNPFSRGDAEGAENVSPGSDPGRGFIDYRTDLITYPIDGPEIWVTNNSFNWVPIHNLGIGQVSYCQSRSHLESIDTLYRIQDTSCRAAFLCCAIVLPPFCLLRA